MKSGRQGTILRIVSEQSIETQNQLMDELKKRGITATQAIRSRFPGVEYTWNENLTRYFAQHCGEEVDWVVDLGVQFASEKSRTPSQPTLSAFIIEIPFRVIICGVIKGIPPSIIPDPCLQDRFPI